MGPYGVFAVGMLIVVLLTGCVAPATPSGQSSSVTDGLSAEPSRKIAIAFRYELTSMSPKTAQAAGGQMQVLFNGGMSILDGKREPRPLLAERLPQLHSSLGAAAPRPPGEGDSWKVFPDGRMETVYALRPNLTWHDGQPLTADDFVFTLQVYADAGLGFNPRPQDLIDEVVAPNARTVVVRWKSLYPAAGELGMDFVPLPRAILEQPFAAYKQNLDAQAFLNHPYWTSAFVGTGPYRVLSWDPGAQLEVAAFEGYALGRPRVSAMTVRIIGDENAVLAAVLADQLQFAADNTMRFEHGVTLKRDWATAGKGQVLFRMSNTITNMVQFRPELLKEPGLLDKRVRQAMLWSVDRQALLDGLYEGEGSAPIAVMPSDDRFYPVIQAGVPRYSYDPRRTEALMTEAGMVRGRDGFFGYANGDPFRPEFMVIAGTSFERGQAIIADTWARSGIQVSSAVQSAAQQRDNQARASFPGIAMQLLSTTSAVSTFTSSEVASPANRWSGNNRGGWAHPEYDRLFNVFNSTLDHDERARLAVQLMSFLNDEAPAFPMYHDMKVTAYVTAVTGPDPESPLWNIHEWLVS